MPKTFLPGRAITLIVVFVMAAIHCLAQTDAATISGRVADPTGAVVPGAAVQLQSAERGTFQETTTNSSGIYVFPAVQPGVYHITVRKDGFHQVDYVGLTANTQAHIEQNFRLQLGSVTESVTVRADAVNVNTTDGAVSTVIDHKFVESMPLNGRSFQDLLTLAPGVTLVANPGGSAGSGGELTVNGQRTEANYFTVDGVSATVGTSPGNLGSGAGLAGTVPAETVLGTTQSIVSIDALQEFRASTSTYSAEYGRTPGGQFSFTTRSGTNAWHGTAYDYFRNEALDGNNWFLDQLGQPKLKERQNDFGGTLGGPVLIPGLYNGKDKTFFFFSYEGLRLWTPQGVQTSAVPDPTLRKTAPAPLQPILNAYPLPNAGEDGLNDGLGLYTAAVSFPSSIDNISVRLDHNFGDKFKVFGRYADTPNIASTYGLAIKNGQRSDYWGVTAGATAVITSRQTNDLRFNITQNNATLSFVSTSLGGATPFDVSSLPGPNGKPFPVQGSTLLVSFSFGPSSIFFGTFGVEQSGNAQRQYNVTDTHSWAVGRHNLKFGLDWRRLTTRVVPFGIYEFADFNSEASVLTNSPDFALASTARAAEPVYTNFSVFAEDEWKMTPRLSLSLGLRWDINPPPHNAAGLSPYTAGPINNLATIKLAPAGTPLWQTDWLGFAPRIGLAYQVHQTPGHETVVRGGFGEFYDMGTARGPGFSGIGFSRLMILTGASFPLTSDQLTLPPPSVTPPYTASITAFDPHLRLPYTLQWNVAMEQMLGSNNALTVSYVGSAARRLLTTFQYFPENLGNPNFAGNVCGGCLLITKNGATSDYDALQIQFQRRLSHGLQALASYTWSHSIDEASTNFFLAELERGSSDFDVRHNFQMALTYDVPGSYRNGGLSAVLKHWGLDTRILVNSALPVDLIGSSTIDPVINSFSNYHPDAVPGQPVYLYGSQYPGGRIINYNAFSVATDSAGNPIEGNSGRNSARGFYAWQLNMALRREFPIHESLRLQFRAEAFNLFNHPNFSNINNFLPSGPCAPQTQPPLSCFGVAGSTLNNSLGGLSSLYQTGGPRSLQLALKLLF